MEAEEAPEARKEAGGSGRAERVVVGVLFVFFRGRPFFTMPGPSSGLLDGVSAQILEEMYVVYPYRRPVIETFVGHLVRNHDYSEGGAKRMML